MKIYNDSTPQRWDLINHLIKQRNYKKYLEIGVNDGLCIRKINIEHKDGVDPYPGSEVGGAVVPEINYRMTSDDFFKSIDKNIVYDIIFIDGLHICEQVNRDILNSLNHLNQNGIIVIHDCNPTAYEFQLVPRQTGIWNGDVWKSIVNLRCNRGDLKVSVVDTDWGVGIVHYGDQTLYTKQNADYITNNWEFFDKNRNEILNMISVEEFYNQY